jgi:hypothetical protein
MQRYVVEKKDRLQTPHSERDGVEASWAVLELPSRIPAGSLRRKGDMFIAESEKHRNTSEAANGLLVLKMAFRSDLFFVQNEGQLQKLAEQDLI